MKKLYSMMMMVMMGMMAYTLTACDDTDDYIAYTLEGTWRGNMYVRTYYDNRYYEASYSEICFLRDPYTYSSGEGYWVDYYSNAPWDYVANHIRWTVNYGDISVHFVEENTNVVIRYNDYALNDSYFEGTLIDGSNHVDFRLTHVASPNWNNYGWGYDYWYDDYYYSKGTRAGGDSVKVEKPKRTFGESAG